MGTPIGRILLMPRGDYDPNAVYNALDWVRYDGASWVCKADNTTGIAPSSSATANWAVMAEDGTVGGWSSITGKPFKTIGAGLNVDTQDTDEPLYVDCTGSIADEDDEPVSGDTVYNYLDANYYDKTHVNKLAQYAGEETFGNLVANASTILKVENKNKYYYVTDDTGQITNANRSYFMDSLPVGTHFRKGSFFIVVETVIGGTTYYKFAYFGGGRSPEVYYEITDSLLTYSFNTTNFPNNAIKTTSAIEVSSSVDGDKYSSISVPNDGTCTVSCPNAISRTLRITVK